MHNIRIPLILLYNLWNEKKIKIPWEVDLHTLLPWPTFFSALVAWWWFEQARARWAPSGQSCRGRHQLESIRPLPEDSCFPFLKKLVKYIFRKKPLATIAENYKLCKSKDLAAYQVFRLNAIPMWSGNGYDSRKPSLQWP